MMNVNCKIRLVLGIVFVLSVSSLKLFAKEAPYHQSKEGVLISGYDPVAYIKQNKAVEGKESFTHQYERTKVRFSSKANLQAFVKNPKKYIPQYKGWCAYAMADSGELVKVNPEAFKVIDGKTYLFYKTWLSNTLKKWNEGNDAAKVKRADQNWLKNHAQ